MGGAIEVVEYFRAHARRVQPALGSSGESRAAGVPGRVRRILGRAGGAWVSRTDLHKALGHSVPAPELDAALGVLVDEGRTERRTVPTGGRTREEWRATDWPVGNMKNEEGRPDVPLLHSSFCEPETAQPADPERRPSPIAAEVCCLCGDPLPPGHSLLCGPCGEVAL